MLGMSSGATATVLIIAIVSLCLLANYVSSHIRDVRVAKYVGQSLPISPAPSHDDDADWV
jgi:hypothetical protein